MLGSVLILTFMVLIQEERFAMGQPGYFAAALEQMSQQSLTNVTGEAEASPPTN
jgi:hypothetical protein